MPRAANSREHVKAVLCFFDFRSFSCEQQMRTDRMELRDVILFQLKLGLGFTVFYSYFNTTSCMRPLWKSLVSVACYNRIFLGEIVFNRTEL